MGNSSRSREVLGDGLGAADAVHPGAEHLAGLALVVEAPDDADGGLGGVLGRQAQRLLAEVDLLLADVAAEQHLVAGGGLAVGPALGAEEADVGDVVLAAAVRAAGDVGADAADVGQAGLVEGGADGVGQAAALGDGEVAGVGARAGDDVAGQLGARLGHADGGRGAGGASGSWPSDRPRNTRFWRLVMRTSAPSSRWIEASARNWSVVMSPRRA